MSKGKGAIRNPYLILADLLGPGPVNRHATDETEILNDLRALHRHLSDAENALDLVADKWQRGEKPDPLSIRGLRQLSSEIESDRQSVELWFPSLNANADAGA
ncbi:MAG: hypothetical protein LAO51_13555 [Acidobacteriia bacterium]|nr:hypothetical protein [Terriglobia bacterium]